MTRLAAFLMAAIALCAADEKKAKPQLPPAVRSIVDLARGTAPEFFVNAVADLVEKGAIADREARVELLEEAFALAPGAKEAYRLTAIPGTPQDTRALHRGKAAELKLDALSLQSRIVSEMIPLDRVKARAMFEQVARPALDPRACEDPLVADVSAYYQMAGAIAQGTFTEAQKEKSAHAQFLEAVLDGARSPGELLPFLKTIGTVRLTPPQRELLWGAFAAKLESIGADYRPFAMTYDALKSEVEGLRSAEVASAFRDYAAAQAGAARCAPDFGPRIYGDGEDEIHPAKIESGIEAHAYFESGDSRDIARELRALREIPRRDRPESGFGNRLADFLGDFSAWQPEGENIDAFHQRATVWRALMEITPAGADRDRLDPLCAEFLARADAQQDHPEEWLYQVEILSSGAGVDAARMLELFRASGDPALGLYANYFSGSNGTSK